MKMRLGTDKLPSLRVSKSVVGILISRKFLERVLSSVKVSVIIS